MVNPLRREYHPQSDMSDELVILKHAYCFVFSRLEVRHGSGILRTESAISSAVTGSKDIAGISSKQGLFHGQTDNA